MRHRFGGLACVGEPQSARGECPIAHPAWCVGVARCSGKSSRRRKPSAEEEETTSELIQIQAVVKAIRCVNHPPGPCRGWGRHSLAQIHAQREPVIPPAGTGAEYRSPRRVSWRFAPRDWGQTARRPFEANGRTTDQREPCGDDSSMNCLLATRPRAVRRAHRCRRKGVLGVPAGAGLVSPPGLADELVSVPGQVDLGDDRRRGLREVGRRLPEESMGKVPLQSG